MEDDKLILPDSISNMIQFRVGELVTDGYTIVDTNQYTVEAVRMAYMRELRKVKDVLGIEQQRLVTIPLQEGLVRLEVSPEPTTREGAEFKIL